MDPEIHHVVRRRSGESDFVSSDIFFCITRERMLSRTFRWGQSAGAISIGLHMVANGGNNEGMFRGAVMVNTTNRLKILFVAVIDLTSLNNPTPFSRSWVFSPTTVLLAIRRTDPYRYRRRRSILLRTPRLSRGLFPFQQHLLNDRKHEFSRNGRG